MDPKIAQFIQDALGSNKYEVIALAGDASTRRYYRLVLGQKTWVLMSWDPFDANQFPFLNVQRHFKKNGVLVPEVVRMSPELGQVILEDLGDLTLERKFWENQDQSLAMPFYEQAIDELIKMHYNATLDKDPNCSAFKIMFDTDKFLWEMNYGREHLLEKLCGLKISPTVSSQLDKIFLKICQTLHEEPKYISHRDYHSRNVMLTLGKTRIIDFQDARLGPIQYDLVSLVHDSYVNMAPQYRAHILDNYLQKAKPFLPKDFSRAHFDEIFRLQIIQRCFKACGSFASFYNNRQDKRYLKYLSNTLKTVDHVLKEHDEFKPFQKFIEDNGLLERNFEA